jgi:hypothetical protein
VGAETLPILICWRRRCANYGKSARVGSVITVAPFLFRIEQQLSTILEEREAASSLWVPVETLRDRSLHQIRPVPGLPAEHRFPAIDLEGTPLWGFTYRVLCDLLQVEIPEE